MSSPEPGPTLAEAQQKEPPLVERAYEVRAEMKVRHIELKSISERLDHVAAVSRAQRWGVRSQLLFGGLAGGVIGFIPFIASGPGLPFVIAYLVALAAALILAALHRDAATDIAAERADSILAIKEHIDNTMLRTETPRLQAPTRRLGPGSSPPESSPESPSPQRDPPAEG
jgi:hypothetical protein